MACKRKGMRVVSVVQTNLVHPDKKAFSRFQLNPDTNYCTNGTIMRRCKNSDSCRFKAFKPEKPEDILCTHSNA